MNGDDGSVRNTPEGIFHRMETGDSPFYQNLGTDEIPAAAILFPLPYELLREDGHDPDSGDSFEKALDSQLEYRLAGELQELLGQMYQQITSVLNVEQEKTNSSLNRNKSYGFI